ncbi:MAG: nucleotidyltransferase domain-containing protein [Candidatus Methanomethylicia archaeon]
MIEVQNQLEDNINRKVDLIHLNPAPLLLTYEVISKGRLILDRDPASRIEYETKVLREFLDVKPRLEEYYRLVLHMKS